MKTKLLQIRISQELKSVLVDQAAKAGMSASEYVRFLIEKILAGHYVISSKQRALNPYK